MPKTPPSHADLALIAELTQLDVHVSRGQLDRWRQRGLLPRVTVERLGAHGSRALHDERTRLIAGFLGACARRGLSWQALGLGLLVIGEPPAPRILRTCTWWVLDQLKLPDPDPALSPEELVEAERKAEGPLFRNFQMWAKQSGIKGRETRNELAYALLQERLGDEYGPDQAAEIEHGQAMWKESVVGGAAASSVVLYTVTPARLHECRRLLSAASDDDLEAAGYIYYLAQCLTINALDDASQWLLLQRHTSAAACFKVVEILKTSESLGQTPLDLLIELVGLCSEELKEWAWNKAARMVLSNFESLKERHPHLASGPDEGLDPSAAPTSSA